MENNEIKLELIEWLTQLQDEETIAYLKKVKDANLSGKDWWEELTDEQREGIERGLKDIDEGRTISHEEVKRKYGIE